MHRYHDSGSRTADDRERPGKQSTKRPRVRCVCIGATHVLAARERGLLGLLNAPPCQDDAETRGLRELSNTGKPDSPIPPEDDDVSHVAHTLTQGRRSENGRI